VNVSRSKKQQLPWLVFMAINSDSVAGSPAVEVHALAQQLTPDSSPGVFTQLIWALDVLACNLV
jgi:hypothetical protein